MRKLTIKEVSAQFGISQDTLRYYERVGMIPAVPRTAAGRRDYQDEDLGWVELALCMRSAGLPVEAMIQYVKLCQQGDGTFAQRLQLLQDQRAVLVAQAKQIQATMDRLAAISKRWRPAFYAGRRPVCSNRARSVRMILNMQPGEVRGKAQGLCGPGHQAGGGPDAQRQSVPGRTAPLVRNI